MESSIGVSLEPPAGVVIGLCSLRHRSGSMLLPRARLQNLFDLRKCEVAFFLAIIKMRRNADARLRTVIYQNLPCQQFMADFHRVRTIDRHWSCVLGGVVAR